MSTIRAEFKGQLGQFSLDVTFSIPSKGITAFFGPSGCGKSSVLRCVAGLNHLPSGQLSINDQSWQSKDLYIPTYKRAIGYVFQDADLFHHLSVKENLLFGYKRSHNKKNVPNLDEIIELLGLAGLLQRSTQTLSGGERQRVAIGRALMSGPEILLMDEPLAALDQFNKDEILPYLEKMHEHLAIPVLYVSHDLSEIERLADYMILMDKGRVQASGPLEQLLANPDLPLARMPDAAMVVTGRVVAYDEDYELTTMAVLGGELIVSGKVGQLHSLHRLRIAASDISLCRTRAPGGSSILNGPMAKIAGAIQSQAHQMTVFLNLGKDGQGAGLVARITRKSWDKLELKKGDVIHALIKGVALAK